MKDKIFYWQSWDKPFRYIFWFLLIIFLILAILIPVLQLLGTDHLIKWNIFSQESSYTFDYFIFSKGPFSFSINADKKLITEFFGGGQLPDMTGASQLVLAIMMIGMLVYLSIVTLLKRSWYLIAMGGYLAFVILLNIESVQLFGWQDTKILILLFVLILPTSYYLHAYSNQANLIKRLWVMALIMGVLGLLILFFSDTEHPFGDLFAYGIMAPYILLILFIISVAHEILAFFLNIITQSKGIANATRLRHFLLLSIIYLANILLSYLYATHYIDWQLVYINPFILLLISSLLGIWGIKMRGDMYTGASDSDKIWPVFYMILSIVSFSILAFFMFTLNDPFLKVISDIIIYAHLVIGVAFLLYVLYNFIALIEGGYEIRKVMYKPTNLPYFTYRLMSIIGIVALFSIRGFEYPIWYSMGGYSNVKADLAHSFGFTDVAKAYFENADAFAYHNHKANYNLGIMMARNEPSKAITYFKHATDQQPTAQAVINAANLQEGQQDRYDALFTLQEGNELVPNDLHIYNNLALQFIKLRLLDSAAYYWQLAGDNPGAINDNRLAFKAQYGRSLGEDSIKLFKNLTRVGKANAAALGWVTQTPDFTNADHMFDMALLNNWLFTDLPQVGDSSLYYTGIIIDSTTNREYREQLLYNWSVRSFVAGNVSAAMDGLLNLGLNSTTWSDRAKLALAKIYLYEGAYQQASDLLLELNYKKLYFELAVAQLENGNLKQAKVYWADTANQKDKFLSSVAGDILATLYADEPSLTTDSRRYIYARYRRFFIDETAENEIIKNIEDDNLRIDIALDLAAYYHHMDNPQGAMLMLKNIEGLNLDTDAYQRYLTLQALITYKSEDAQYLLTQFDSLFTIKPADYLLEATLNHLAGMTLDSTTYLQMAQDNPFLVDAVLIGVKHFENEKDPFYSYNMLANAVQANPDSPVLLKAYILKALDVGLEQFAENALYEYGQKFSGQSYLLLKTIYKKKKAALDKLDAGEQIE